MIIYKATNLTNGKIYIGKYQGKYFSSRKGSHRYQAFTLNSKFYFHRALRKYGWESFGWDIIDRANSKEELSQKEIYWIHHFRSYTGMDNNNGYNMTVGGDGVKGFPITEKYRESMSHLNKEDVYNIKKLLKESNLSSSEIANRFNISNDTLWKINKGSSWGHVRLTNNDILPYRSNKQSIELRVNSSKRYTSLEKVYSIRMDYMKGVKLSDIIIRHNVSYLSARNILSLKSYPNVSIPKKYVAMKIKKNISNKDKEKIVNMSRDTDLYQREIGEIFGISQARVGQIIREFNIKKEEIK